MVSGYHTGQADWPTRVGFGSIRSSTIQNEGPGRRGGFVPVGLGKVGWKATIGTFADWQQEKTLNLNTFLT